MLSKNCWKVISILKEYCNELICVLDWFHIGKHFENVIKAINAEYSNELIGIKSLFWHGKAIEGIKMLEQLKNKVGAKEDKSKVNGLLIYLKSNTEHIANYNKQAMENKPYTSQVAESTVEHLINDRYKKSQKMQWTRENAHNILQIRASMASNEWDYIWQETILNAFKIAA